MRCVLVVVAVLTMLMAPPAFALDLPWRVTGAGTITQIFDESGNPVTSIVEGIAVGSLIGRAQFTAQPGTLPSGWPSPQTLQALPNGTNGFCNVSVATFTLFTNRGAIFGEAFIIACQTADANSGFVGGGMFRITGGDNAWGNTTGNGSITFRSPGPTNLTTPTQPLEFFMEGTINTN